MTETRLDVKGMTCRSCVFHINHALGTLDGIDTVDVRLAEGKVIVRHTPELDAATLTGTIAEAGYEATVAD